MYPPPFLPWIEAGRIDRRTPITCTHHTTKHQHQPHSEEMDERLAAAAQEADVYDRLARSIAPEVCMRGCI